MPKQRIFVIRGMEPVNADVNRYLRACDLGTDGAYRYSSITATVIVSDTCTPEQYERQPEAIRTAFERQGWCNIYVQEMHDY